MVVMADASQSTFTAPEDQELKNIIDKLANFVARNGSKFEEMTRQKQKDNPKFGFLNSGNTYYNYYRWRVSVEIAKNQTPQSHKQQGGTNSPYSSAQSIVQQAIVQQSINSAPWQQQQTAMPQIPAIHPPPPFAQPPATPAVYQQAPQPPRDLDLNEFDGMLQKLMDTGSKDAISTGRGWVFNNAKTSTHCQFIMEYILKRSLAPDLAFTKKLHLVYIVNDILHHVARKSAQDLQTAVEAVVVPMFCNAIQGESGDGLKKLNKVLGIWETNSFLDKSTMQKLKNPESSESIVTAAKEKFYPQPVSYDYQQAVSGQYPTNAYAYQQYYNQYTQYPPTSVPYEQPTTAAAAGQYEQQATSTPASATVQEEQQPQSSEADEEKPAESEKQTPQVDTEQKDFHSDNDNVQTNKDDQQQSSMDQGESEEQYPPHSYNHPPFPPQFNDPYYSGQQPPPHFSQDYRPPFPPFPLPNFNRPPPNFNEPPPNFHEPGFPVRPPFRQVFDYQHRDDYEPAPHEYEVHGDIDEYGPPDGYGPPVPPPPRPIIPDALYYELPAGLIAPMVKLSDIDYKPLDPRDIRLPAPQPPSDRLMAAVEAFYSPPNHERPRNSDGWEQGGLFEFFKAKLPFIKERDAREKEKPQPPVSNLSSPPQSPERRRRSHSRSPPRGRSHSTSPPYRQTSRSRSRSRSPVRRGRSRSKSPVRRGRSRSRSPVRRGRSRSRSRSPHRRRSYSRSRSRSRSPCHRRSRSPSPRRRHSPSPPRKRSLTPPSFNPFMTKTLDTRLDESNVGHQLLKKMGWEGAGLGKDEKGIQDPIKAGEVRARHNQYKGIGVETDDEFERFRYNRSYTYNRRRLKTIQEKAKQSAANSEEPATGSPR